MKEFKKMKNKKGFTLVELMITVGIIAILSGVLLQVLNPQLLRSKTRDKQRISDLKRIQSALELYYADNREYPVSSSWSSPPAATLSNYLDPMPQDPLNTGSHQYLYRTDSDGYIYCLMVYMEEDSSGNSGSACSSWAPSDDACYSVSNP